jgi:SEC-C motif domain protein
MTGIGSMSPCPCGAGDPFGRCCLPLHRGERRAATAEELMRSRYSAYCVGDGAYLWRTWHPRTRPAEPVPTAPLDWVNLEIIEVVGGQPGDERGVVEFRACHRQGDRTGVLHERSRFAVRAGRWFYLDAEMPVST